MKTNVGTFDAGARIVGGCITLMFAFHGLGWWALLGFVPIITGSVAFCPLYRLFHWDTARWENDFEHRHGRG